MNDILRSIAMVYIKVCYGYTPDTQTACVGHTHYDVIEQAEPHGARILGMMAAIELTPDKANRAPFKEPGKAGMVCRDLCFNNGLVMRSVFDRMVISPPLIISKVEIDELVEKAVRTLDQTQSELQSDGLI